MGYRVGSPKPKWGRVHEGAGLAARVALAAGLFALAVLLGACASPAPLPPKAIALNTLGADALSRGDLSTAEARLSVALEYNPRFVEAWVNLGYVELRRGNFEQARRDFVKAQRLNRDIPAPHHALGLLADVQGSHALAEAHYRAALAVDPGFAPARANLGRSLFARGQYENAREQFERLIAVAPDSIEGWAGEAESLLELGRTRQAEAIVSRARELFGDAPPLMLLVARGRLAVGDWDEAEALLAPIVGGRDRARAAAAWSWIAVARAGRGDAAGADEAAYAALAIDPKEAVARFALRLTGGGRRSP